MPSLRPPAKVRVRTYMMPGPGVMASNKDAERNAAKVVMDIVYMFPARERWAPPAHAHPVMHRWPYSLVTPDLIRGDVNVAGFEALAGRFRPLTLLRGFRLFSCQFGADGFHPFPSFRGPLPSVGRRVNQLFEGS